MAKYHLTNKAVEDLTSIWEYTLGRSVKRIIITICLLNRAEKQLRILDCLA